MDELNEWVGIAKAAGWTLLGGKLRSWLHDKLMYIQNDDTQNDYPLCRLKLVIVTLEHLNQSTNQNSLKSP